MWGMRTHLLAGVVALDAPGVTAVVIVLCVLSAVLLAHFFVIAVRRDLAELAEDRQEPTEDELESTFGDPWPNTAQQPAVARSRS